MNKIQAILISCLLLTVFIGVVDEYNLFEYDDDYVEFDYSGYYTSNGNRFELTKEGLQKAIWDLNETGGSIHYWENKLKNL